MINNCSALSFELLLITDKAACHRAGRTVEQTLTSILNDINSRCVAILVRDKKATISEIATLISNLKPLTDSTGVLLLVHSYPQLALEYNLAGVHLSSTTAIAPVRQQLPPEMLIGVSRHGTDALDQDDIGLANYATISPVYSPLSKPEDQRNTLGLQGLRDSVKRSYRPLVALGGIEPGRVSDAIAQGAKAVAVIGAVMGAENPASVVQLLLDKDTHRAAK
ncbi:MAG: thiamine phosphate synthase [Coleofasciculus sp. A1-SPW-01]|uniref:thiamine phosphate synthase n=1 Tax=Coleofasciculus sp. A1-SPW-01 TaxID=3070819 RepID=UPI003302F421